VCIFEEIGRLLKNLLLKDPLFMLLLKIIALNENIYFKFTRDKSSITDFILKHVPVGLESSFSCLNKKFSINKKFILLLLNFK
jgi:hypothetical protein